MYNFESQQKMLSVSLALLEEKGINNISAIGGGTGLAAYYWDHRYSTDIDIFIMKPLSLDKIKSIFDQTLG